MFDFPFSGYPTGYLKKDFYNNYNKLVNNKQKNSITNSLNQFSNTINLSTKSNPNFTTNSNQNQKVEQPILELLGIKLYLDDLIILGILFFLYKQNVKDEMLYIILLLLLFT